MGYDKLSVAELKEILSENNYEYDSKVKKATLVDICRTNELTSKKLKEKNIINDKLKKKHLKEDSENKKKIKKKNKILLGEFSGLTKEELMTVEIVTEEVIELARNNGNIVEDITLDHKLIIHLGVDYSKVVFAKIQKELNIKNIDIVYTTKELEQKIIILDANNASNQIGQKELEHSVDNILKGITTKYETDEVKHFLSTINDYPLLTHEKETKLGKIILEYNKKIENDEDVTFFEREEYEEARSLLSLSNKRLVVSVAKKYVNRGLELIDLVMEGMLGLEKAIMKFDYEQGFKFSTYATWWVRQGITRAIADKSKVIRVPVHMVETINKVIKVQRELTQKLGQEPTYEEIGQALDPQMEVEEIEHIFNIAKDPIALEMPIGDDNSSLESFIKDDKYLSQDKESEKIELRTKLLKIIDEIPEREGEVLLYRYGLYELDFEPYERKIKFLKKILKKMTKKEIDSIELLQIMKETKEIKESQKIKYSKRIEQNNEKLSRKKNDLDLIRHKKNKKSIERIEKLEKQINIINENNQIYLEKILKHTEEQLQILIAINKLTGGIVKALTLEEVGKLFDVTRERIRQIETKGKRKLKAFVDKDQLDLYV